DHRREEIRNRGRVLEQAERKQKEWRALQNGLSEAFLAGALVIILAVGTRLVHQGTMTPLTLAIAAAIGTLGLEPLIRMTDVLADFQVALASAGRLFAMMDRQPVIRDPMNPVAAGSIQPSVSFRDVTFWYPGENGNSGGRPVLEHISFTIHPGERVGLVGPSGAGKTTVVNLLLRFWDPAAGRILLGGHDLLSLSQKIIRSRIALVSQRTHIFDTTIRKNLLIGNPDASEHQVWEAVEKANLRAFIETLPHGLETSAGEMGARLSGGQRQRIAIARAFLKDAPLLVLDEATSNLDTGNERTIQQTLTRLMHDRTTLIIAHRLTTVRDADRILVLKEGHVTQEGTHHELLRRKGTYQRLFAHQQDELDNLAFPKPAF
ncbi:MAG: ABC transporter ATP-binding protein, partial [Calditrichota bacterium]